MEYSLHRQSLRGKFDKANNSFKKDNITALKLKRNPCYRPSNARFKL